MLGVFDLLAGPTNVRALAPIDWPMPSIVLTVRLGDADCLARTGRLAAARAATRRDRPRLDWRRRSRRILVGDPLDARRRCAHHERRADGQSRVGVPRAGDKPLDLRSRPRLPRCGRGLCRACRRSLRPSPRCRGPARDRPREARSARFALDGRAIAARDSCAHERLSSNLSSSAARSAWLSRTARAGGRPRRP